MKSTLQYRVCLVTHPLSALWSVTSHNTHKQVRYTHTHNGLAWKVSTMRHAQSHTQTASLSRRPHKAARRNTHRRRQDFEKCCCRWQFSLKL